MAIPPFSLVRFFFFTFVDDWSSIPHSINHFVIKLTIFFIILCVKSLWNSYICHLTQFWPHNLTPAQKYASNNNVGCTLHKTQQPTMMHNLNIFTTKLYTVWRIWMWMILFIPQIFFGWIPTTAKATRKNGRQRDKEANHWKFRLWHICAGIYEPRPSVHISSHNERRENQQSFLRSFLLAFYLFPLISIIKTEQRAHWLYWTKKHNDKENQKNGKTQNGRKSHYFAV